MKKINTIINLFGAATLATSTVNADVLERKFCIFDPVGNNGPMFNVMKSSKPSALKWGVNLELAAYTDEKIAAEDLKAGQCDAALLTSTRAREFNRFTGSLEALGAITSDEEMKMILETLNQAKAAKLLTSGKYEVAGILPAGAVYLFLRDRNINSVEKLQGKKIATLDYDHASLTMVRHVGASVVGASSSSFAGKFNNGSVDAAYGPAIAYTPLELYKGIGTSGGVFDYKLAQFSFQIIIQKDRFPEDFGQNARDYTASIYDEAHKMVANAEAEINPQHWMRPTKDEVAGYDNLLREVRISLKEEGVYDPKALRLMLKVRCKTNPDRAECVEGRE